MLKKLLQQRRKKNTLMLTDPQFWVAVAFFIFVAVIFNPVRKMLTSNLDTQIKQIKASIDEAENLKNEAQVASK